MAPASIAVVMRHDGMMRMTNDTMGIMDWSTIITGPRTEMITAVTTPICGLPTCTCSPMP